MTDLHVKDNRNNRLAALPWMKCAMQFGEETLYCWVNSSGVSYWMQTPPDFEQDIAVMHEAERRMPLELREKYTDIVFSIVCRDRGLYPAMKHFWCLVFATADQRARAMDELE